MSTFVMIQPGEAILKTVCEAKINHSIKRELYANQGLRTGGLGYTGDVIRQKFTAYQRDTETGLDYAQARYCSSWQGRFTSPDPLMTSAKATDPQSWNRYSYVGNKPMTFSDPSGMSRQPGGRGIRQLERRHGFRASH